jgi:hypothetical protein
MVRGKYGRSCCHRRACAASAHACIAYRAITPVSRTRPHGNPSSRRRTVLASCGLPSMPGAIERNLAWPPLSGNSLAAVERHRRTVPIRQGSEMNRDSWRWQSPFEARDAVAWTRRPAGPAQAYRQSVQISDTSRTRRSRKRNRLATHVANLLILLAPRPGLEPGTYGLTVPGDGISWDVVIRAAPQRSFTGQQLTSIVIPSRLGAFALKLARDWHQGSYGLWQEIRFPRFPSQSNRSRAVRS